MTRKENCMMMLSICYCDPLVAKSSGYITKKRIERGTNTDFQVSIKYFSPLFVCINRWGIFRKSNSQLFDTILK
jgi:hypothetical protein